MQLLIHPDAGLTNRFEKGPQRPLLLTWINFDSSMLINIIHKGSLPDSSSTTYPLGASLSDILFSFVLEKYIVCDVCGLRSPSFESSSVLYISPTDTSSMQNLILQGLQQKWQKSCSRCNKNTWHVESSYILQPPKYLLLFVGRFRYLNNNVTKDTFGYDR